MAPEEEPGGTDPNGLPHKTPRRNTQDDKRGGGNVKGVVSVNRVNAIKLAVMFKQFNTANNFIMNEAFLQNYHMKAYIPAREIEKTGIIRYVPTNISNKDLFTKLSSNYEIIAVRRFTKKSGDERVPLQTLDGAFGSGTIQSGNYLVISNAQNDTKGYYACEGFVNDKVVSQSNVFIDIDDLCELPLDKGPGSDYSKRWFFDNSFKKCSTFYYGGVGGNKNNFVDEASCRHACEI